MKIVQCDGVLSLTQLPVHDFRVGFQIFNKFDNDVFLIFIRRYLFLSGIGEKFACPKSIKGSIFSRYQFPVQKEGLELWKNVIFRNAGQISHDIPTRLLVLITMKCRVPDFILFDFMENFRFPFFPKRSRIATNFRKKVPRILNVMHEYNNNIERNMPMKRLCLQIILVSVFICGCASQTWIYSIPEKVKVVSPEGKLIGVTPFCHWDRSFSGKETSFILKNDGYKDKEITIKKDKIYYSRLIFPPILALPWLMGYEDEYYYELEKIQDQTYLKLK